MTRGQSVGAVPYLRRRTAWRALDSYRRWVGKAVGWWSILYMLFWLVIFVIAGVETLQPLAQPLPSPAPLLAAAGAVLLALSLLGGRTPPLILDRRDLYRLALGPQIPWLVLRWRYGVKQASWVVVALLLGGIWSLVAPPLFGGSAPFAAPVLALVALLLLDLRWLRYVGHSWNDVGPAYAARSAANRALLLLGGGALLLLAADALTLYLGAQGQVLRALNPLAALTDSSPLTLVVPLLLAALSRLAVTRSLAQQWPPRFAPQSLVLTQLQAMRTFQLLAVLAGGGLGARNPDDGERRRLLDALYDKPGATRPRRSLPMPGPQAPQWAGLAWRTASALYRRPLPRLGGALLLALLAASTTLFSGGSLAQAVTPAGAPATTGNLLGGALTTLLAALFVARAAAGLLGPYFDAGVRPVDALTRSFGRSLPAFLILACMLVVALVAGSAAGLLPGGQLPLPTLIGAVTLIGIVVLALEKYSSWSGAAASRLEPQLVAAMLAALPALLLGALGVGDWTLISQLLLLGLVSIIAV